MTIALMMLLLQDPVDSKGPELVERLEGMTVRAVEAASPFVVSVHVDREKEAPPPRLRNRRQRPGVFRTRPDAPVSGTIIRSDGLILTTYFNIRGRVRGVTVRHGDEEYEAEIVGYNGTLDVALLRIKAEGLPEPEFADLADLLPGDPVYALGRAPNGGGITANVGVISALRRYDGRMLQHDGSANFGNTGGPLVDARGRILGITALITTERGDRFGQNSGISFAARIDRINAFMPDLLAGTKIKAEMRPYLGVTLNEAYTGKGAGINEAQAGTAAAKGGMQKGDVIVKFGDKTIETWNDLVTAIRSRKVGDEVTVVVLRDGEEVTLEIKLGGRPMNN